MNWFIVTWLNILRHKTQAATSTNIHQATSLLEGKWILNGIWRASWERVSLSQQRCCALCIYCLLTDANRALQVTGCRITRASTWQDVLPETVRGRIYYQSQYVAGCRITRASTWQDVLPEPVRGRMYYQSQYVAGYITRASMWQDVVLPEPVSGSSAITCNTTQR
jgi:hypothetical protein